MKYEVRMGDWHKIWKCPSWHVFNGKCQVAGPYKTREKAEHVRDEMEDTCGKS